jgi:thioredoxin-related protein
MMLSRNPQLLKLFSHTVLFGAMFIALSLSGARAAELVMFEQAGCAWCDAFDREIAPVYGKTEEGLRAPLRRVDIAQALPSDLAFIETERLTPLFVLVDRGREIGRIRGYPGEDHFWGLLGVLVAKLDNPETVKPGTGEERTQLSEKSLYASD